MGRWKLFRNIARLMFGATKNMELLPLLMPSTWQPTQAAVRRLFGSRDPNAPDPWVTLIGVWPDSDDVVPLTVADLKPDSEAKAVATLRQRFEKSDTKIEHGNGFITMQGDAHLAAMLLAPDFCLAFHNYLESEQVVVAIPTRNALYATTVDRIETLAEVVDVFKKDLGNDGLLTDAFFILEAGEIVAMSRRDHPLVGKALKIISNENGVLTVEAPDDTV